MVGDCVRVRRVKVVVAVAVIVIFYLLVRAITMRGMYESFTYLLFIFCSYTGSLSHNHQSPAWPVHFIQVDGHR